MKQAIPLPANIRLKDAAKEVQVSERTIKRWVDKYINDPRKDFKLGGTRRITLDEWERIKSLEYCKNF